MGGRKTVTEAGTLASGIQSGGIVFLRDSVRTEAGYARLMRNMGDRGVQQALSTALVAEGARLLDIHKRSGKPTTEIPKLASPLKEMLDDPVSRDRLRNLLITTRGRAVLRSAVATPQGDFLALGYMFNTDSGKKLVMRLLTSQAGIQAAITIIDAATYSTPDPYFLPKLPPFRPTADGRRFRESFASDGGANLFRANLISHAGRQTMLDFFTNKETEARSCLRDVLSTPEGVRRLHAVLVSEQGREFLELLGESGLGRRIGGDDLWLTGGGRVLVRQLLRSPEGREAIFALVTGLY